MADDPHNDSIEAYEDQQETIDESIEVLRDLVEWAAATGSWDAPCWDAAIALLEKEDPTHVVIRRDDKAG